MENKDGNRGGYTSSCFKMVLSTSPHLAVRAALPPNMAFQQIALLAHADYSRRGMIEGIYEAIWSLCLQIRTTF